MIGLSFAQGMDITWCRQPEMGLPRPDAVLYLNLSAEEAEKRDTYGGERYEKRDFQIRVAKNFDLLKEKDWKVNMMYMYIIILSTDRRKVHINVCYSTNVKCVKCFFI